MRAEVGKPNGIESLRKHLDLFQELMLGILERRAIFCSLEKLMIGKPKNSVEDNSFIKSYTSDYLRSQLADLRLFFERDSKAYRLSYVTDHCKKDCCKAQHKLIFDTYWKKGSGTLCLEDAANKAIFHREMDFNASSGVAREDLDICIDQLDSFLDQLVSELTTDGYYMSHLVREIRYDEITNNVKQFIKLVGADEV